MAKPASPLIVSRRDQERVQHVRAALNELTDICDPAPVSQRTVQALAELFRSNLFAAHRTERDHYGAWRMGPRSMLDATVFDAYDEILASVQVPFMYDPLHPSAKDRNKVRLMSEIHTHGPDETCAVEDIWPKVGLGGKDQIRVLVCGGPTLLSWVGGFRAEPFTVSERALFASLVPALKTALALRRQLLDAQIVTAGLTVALEALGSPSFIARPAGDPAYANTSGQALLDDTPRDTRARIAYAIRRRPADAHVSCLVAPGLPTHYLVVLRENDGSLAQRLQAARGRWRLTPRECEVLRGVVAGDCGKEIALTLGLHEGSVERHTSSIFRKARCDSRTRLVARFWTDL